MNKKLNFWEIVNFIFFFVDDLCIKWSNVCRKMANELFQLSKSRQQGKCRAQWSVHVLVQFNKI